jgi:hypothetical protein
MKRSETEWRCLLTANAKAGLGMIVTPQEPRRVWEPVCVVGYERGRRNEIVAFECFQYPIKESFDHQLLLCKLA